MRQPMRPVRHRRQYWWIVAQDEGKPYLILGGSSEQESRQKALEMLGGLDFSLREFPTMDRNSASAMLRGKRLEDTHSLHESGRRIGHEKSIRRLRRRRENRR